MLKQIIPLLAISLLGIPAAGQNKGITAEMLAQYRQHSQLSGQDKALANAISVNGLDVLAGANANAIPGGTYFSNKVDSKGITDQKSSGRCWLFTGLNVMRAKMIQHYGLGEFTLSQNYVFFYDQLEKANLFLQSVIDNAKKPMDDRLVDWLFQNPLSDGGQFTGIADLITKYGVVPSEAMPETYSSNNTTSYARRLSELLRQDGLALRQMAAKGEKAARIEARKNEMMGEVYGILVRCFGMPPQKFTWTRTDRNGRPVDTREYTPQSFYKEYIGSDLKGNYLMFMNDPSRPFYKTYEIDLDRHVYDGENWTYLNVPIEDLKQMAISSIKDSTMLYLSCDVGKYYNKKTGYSDPGNYDYADLLGVKYTMNKAERIKTHASASSHAMTLMAVDLTPEGTPRKWMVENSWGPDAGYKGHIIMSDAWFSEYVFRLVVEKKYVPAKLLEAARQKPTLLPAWDPLFAPEP